VCPQVSCCIPHEHSSWSLEHMVYLKQIGEMTGDLVVAGAVDLKRMAQHVLQAGEPAEEGEQP
jgi:hypothetical protein